MKKYTPKVTPSMVASSLRVLGHNVILGKNSANPAIDEITTIDEAWTLSYLPYEEKDWSGLENEDNWGWGILNNEDGYLVDEKSYKNDWMGAMAKFV